MNPLKVALLVNAANTPIEEDSDVERYWLDKAIDAYDDAVERAQDADRDYDR